MAGESSKSEEKTDSRSTEERIKEKIEALSEKDRQLHAEALREGYEDTVCSECKQVFLAFHHFVRCENEQCPMVVRDESGKRKPSLLNQLLKNDSPR